MNGAWLADRGAEGALVDRMPAIEGVFETMRVVVGPRGAWIPLWVRHVDRLLEGSGMIGLSVPTSFDRLRHELLEHIHATSCDLRLRLVFGRLGQELVFGADWEPAPAEQTLVRLHLSSDRVLESFPRHPRVKATRREFYERIQRRAKAVAADEGLCATADDRVFETAIGNLFFEIEGSLCTPPTDGEFPIVRGVCHDFLVSTLADRGHRVERRVPTIDDLRRSDRVWVTNALRGPRRSLVPDAEPRDVSGADPLRSLWNAMLAGEFEDS